MLKQQGFTLIELVIFIAIMAVLGVGILSAFNIAMQKGPDIQNSTKALMLAQERMELIIGQRDANGFASTNDSCVSPMPPAFCTPPPGYIVTSNIANNWGGDADYKVITVTVTGLGSASLEALVANTNF